MDDVSAAPPLPDRLVITTPSGSTDDRSVTVAGVLTDATGAPAVGRTVDIDGAGASLGTATVGSDGRWSAAVLLPDLGTNRLTATTAGGTAQAVISAPIVLTLDVVLSSSHGASTRSGAERRIFPAHGAEVSGAGAAATFVFRAHPGHAVVDDFSLSGPGADRLSLPHARFADLADVLRHTSMVGSDAVIHLSSRDSVTLTGVCKSALRADRDAITLHP